MSDERTNRQKAYDALRGFGHLGGDTYSQLADAVEALLSSENEKLAGMVKRLEIDYGHAVDRSNEFFRQRQEKDAEIASLRAEVENLKSVVPEFICGLHDGHGSCPDCVKEFRKTEAALTHHREAAKGLLTDVLAQLGIDQKHFQRTSGGAILTGIDPLIRRIETFLTAPQAPEEGKS